MNNLIDKLHVCRDNFGTPSISDGVLYYNPTDGGFQCQGYGEWNKRHVALTAYEAFGCNYPRNVEAARRWEELAAEAWPIVFSERALEEYDRACERKEKPRYANWVSVMEGNEREIHAESYESWEDAREAFERITKQIADTGRCELCDERCEGHHTEDMQKHLPNGSKQKERMNTMFEYGQTWVSVEVREFDETCGIYGRQDVHWPFLNGWPFLDRQMAKEV